MEQKEVQVGMRFVKNDGLFKVVKPNPKLPGDWFCRSVKCDTGLWSYDPNDILNNLVPNAESNRARSASDSDARLSGWNK